MAKAFNSSFILLLVVVALAGCNSRQPDATWRRIQEQGVMRVGMEANWVPFEYVDGEGHLAGFDVELAEELAKRLGLEVEFVPNLSFDGLYDALTTERVDAVISAVVADAARSAGFAPSRSYFDAGQVLVVRPEAAGDIKDRGDLRERTLAVQLGSDGDTLARHWQRRLAGVALLHTDSADGALAAVAAGQADAALLDRASALLGLRTLRATGGAGRMPVVNGPPVTGQQYAVILRWESPGLLSAVNAALAAMEQDGWLERLERKWLGP